MATIADATAAAAINTTDQFIFNRSGTDYRVAAENILTFNALDYTVVLKPGNTNTIRHAGMIAGQNPIVRIHGTRSSGLTLNDTIRLLLSMSNAGNSPIDYAALECAVDAFNGGGRLGFYTQVASGALTERMRIDNAGVVRVMNLAGTGNRAVYSDASGNLTNTASDERLKKNIKAIATDEALEIVGALRPVRYNWRAAVGAGEQREMGLIAQEVQAVAPEVVGANNDGMLSLDYAKLTTVLIGAVQALTAQVAELQAQVAALGAA